MPLVKPLRVSVCFVVVCVKRRPFDFAHAKSEALGGLGTMAKALNFLESGQVGLIKILRLINKIFN